MNSIWKLEEKVYQTRALLEVMQDGLSNDVVGINQDYYATTIRTACNVLEEMEQIINEDFRRRREEKKIGEYAEDDTDGEDSLFAGASIFGEPATATPRSSDSFEGSEGCEDSGDRGTAQADRFTAGSFGVTLIEEHEDGSATFEVNGSKEQMGKLFSAFFTEAITKGIDSAEQSTQRWVLEKQIVKKAREFADLMMQWEWADELDYDPQIRKVRVELTDLFVKYGAVR